jgi:Domain of unknown function (DUF1905)/Bacteriocin-protection, YdeI or OmpD-Associated
VIINPLLTFLAKIAQDSSHAEKIGWTFVIVPAPIANQLNPGSKKAFRVKGKLDHFAIKQVALLPIGEGDFMMPLNARMRRGIGKRAGAMLSLSLELDKKPLIISPELLECLEDEPPALHFFNTLTPSHKGYFSKWIESAKTAETKAKRIAQAVNGLSRKLGFGEMLRLK